MALQLKSVDLQQKSNAAAHNTSDFITKSLIVRRGQTFTIQLDCSRDLKDGERLDLCVETGPSPTKDNNTQAVMQVSSSGTSSSTSWSATLGSRSGGTLQVIISIPVNAVIGRYQMTAQLTASTTSSFPVGDFIVLFNPWASGDEVYMSNDEERREYVLNETGFIFLSSGRITWDYGQFEEDILDICLLLLDRSTEYRRNPVSAVAKRYNPIYVGRVLSAMVNSNDDNGVLVGNWTADMSGGEAPSSWSGSGTILRRWSQNGPVKFGQCWVFAGVLCTVLRCLGLPARVITNIESAHDTNRNLVIEEYYNEDGTNIPSPDSVWNFHAWNEVWFVRKDLGSTYDGWQILDATPQELSEGIYCLGPTSQRAVKLGDVNLNFDGVFVFSEVNADKKTYVKYKDGRTVLVHTDTTSVGQTISTKAVGSSSRVDVTNDYKHTEGSSEEREVYFKAQRQVAESSTGITALSAASSVKKVAYAPKSQIIVTLKMSAQPQVGQDVTAMLNLKNASSGHRKVKVNWTATVIVYNRTPVKEILKESQAVSLTVNEEKAIPLKILYSQYKDTITTNNMIHIVAVCHEEKGGCLLVNKIIILKHPPLELKVPFIL
ncbi:protein-glutamine gamma-glutamyltransferase E-like [Xenopus tropicalis]|uniref:protein-glutamine gamma-glutamyltransferase n=1 Tax=Xenopus tropicalis TaxID=8364 RepID=A0A8J1IXZ2_XENTR|nr:protein-glutamine gamma-glutamyltransferase E-like [Xenopus tropicalis]